MSKVFKGARTWDSHYRLQSQSQEFDALVKEYNSRSAGVEIAQTVNPALPAEEVSLPPAYL